MSKDFEPDLVSLIDEDDNEHSFEILDAVETEDGQRYMALLPYSEDVSDVDDGLYYIFQVIEEDGEEQLVTVEDNDLLDSLAEIFEERFDAIFDDDEPDELLQ